MPLFSELMADKDGKYVNKDRSDKEDKPEKHSKRWKCSSTASSLEKRPVEEPKASTSAVAREQNNAGVDQEERKGKKNLFKLKTFDITMSTYIS